MKVTYDPEVDVLRIVLSGAAIEESDESKPGVILDFDKNGNVVGMEILDASRRTDKPQTMEYAIALPVNAGPAGVLVREQPIAEYNGAHSSGGRRKSGNVRHSNKEYRVRIKPRRRGNS